jgi:hypothetical protein
MAKPRVKAQPHDQVQRVIEQLQATSPAVFTAAVSAAAAEVLRAAGLPATERALAKVEHVRTRTMERIQTVESRIEGDTTLPLQVRLAPGVIYRAAEVRRCIAANDAESAVFNAGLLFARIARITALDGAPYVRAGTKALAAQRKGAATGKHLADEKARLFAPIWAEVAATFPKLKHHDRCERAGLLAHERHPQLFRKCPSERTIANLRRRYVADK